MDILFARRQDNQCYIFIKCSTLLISQVCTNYNCICHESVILLISNQYTSPKKTYYSLYLTVQTHDIYPLITLISRLKPSLFLSWPQILQLKIFFTPQSKPFFEDLTTYRTNLTKMMQNLTNNMEKWLTSTQRHFSSQRITKYSKK